MDRSPQERNLRRSLVQKLENLQRAGITHLRKANLSPVSSVTPDPGRVRAAGKPWREANHPCSRGKRVYALPGARRESDPNGLWCWQSPGSTLFFGRSTGGRRGPPRRTLRGACRKIADRYYRKRNGAESIRCLHLKYSQVSPAGQPQPASRRGGQTADDF